jgi:predicted phage terminase large subunit-like protein
MSDDAIPAGEPTQPPPPTNETLQDDQPKAIGASSRLNAKVKGERARRHLRVFIDQTWPILEPSVAFVPNWHIDVICTELEAITRGEYPLAPDGQVADGLVINVPAGTSKTRVVSENWPCWVWASDPSKRFLIATYSQPRTIDANLNARKIIESEWYRTAYPNVQLRGDQNVKQRFDTTERGWRIGVAVGGEGTGLHPDVIIIDDALSADDARSELKRTAALDWFNDTISTRGMTRKVFIIHIAQRLHEEDLAGYMLSTGRYAHVRFPMSYEAERPEGKQPKGYFPPDPRDPRTREGELLWPALIPAAKVAAVSLRLGPQGTAGQMQQRPGPLEGSLFKRGWFGIVGAIPSKVDDAVRFWDVAATEGGSGARTAGVRMVKCGDLFILTGVEKDRLSPAGVDDLMLQTARLDGVDTRVREEQEPGSSGKAVCIARTALLKGFDYDFETSTGDKETRANPLRAQAEAGNVKLYSPAGHPPPPWIKEFLDEVVDFPNGKLKDQVDAGSGALNELTKDNTEKRAGVVW